MGSLLISRILIAFNVCQDIIFTLVFVSPVLAIVKHARIMLSVKFVIVAILWLILWKSLCFAHRKNIIILAHS